MNREQKANAQWRQRFEEIGLSKQFEFVERALGQGHKATVIKCRTCGNVFNTQGVDACYRGQAKTICCPECGTKSDGTVCWVKSQACKGAMDFYAQGHSVKETAQKYGVSEGQVTNATIKFGISNGRDFHTAGAEANATSRRINGEKKNTPCEIYINK